LNFHYKLASQNESVWNRSCSIGALEAGGCYRKGEDSNYVPSLALGIGPSSFVFTFQVLNVSLKHNNSTFSCSISSDGQLQWLHSAHLKVNLTTDVQVQSLAMVSMVSVVVVVVAAVAAALALTVLVRRKWKRNSAALRPEQGGAPI
jgi:hypothetical protein